MSFRIKELWAFVAVGEDDIEGILGMHTPEGWLPLVAADEKRIRSLCPIAAKIAAKISNPVRLVRFSNREDFETIGGQKDRS